LQKQGLAAYIKEFRRNNLDGRSLLHLKVRDLQKYMRVNPLDVKKWEHLLTPLQIDDQNCNNTTCNVF
jgi:hypothetical protein